MPDAGLILFDVDATLISTSRAGIRAMKLAAAEMFGPGVDLDRIEFAGKLDPLIITDVLNLARVQVSPASIAAFHARYRHHLAAVLEHPATIATALPGVMDLLNELERRSHLTLALLTGNYADTGSLKLRACGIDPGRFAMAIWASDAVGTPPSRDELPRVGLARWRERAGAQVSAARAVVIGDTPHDIRCAKVNGCRAIAVATGPFEVDALASFQPDLAIEDLSDTRRVLESIDRWTSPSSPREVAS